MDFVYDKYLNDLFGSENFGEPHSKEQRKQDKNKQGESTKGGKNRQGKDGTKHWLEEEYLPRLQCSKPKYTLSSETLKTFCPENVDAVSYTHLDVYKRQPMRHEARIDWRSYSKEFRNWYRRLV